MSAIEKRDGFTTKWGFILACIGSAVGMGNIWRFPVLVSELGGMTFLIPYFIFVILIGSTGVIEEFALGRAAGAGPVGAFGMCTEMKGNRSIGEKIGIIPILGSLSLAIGYSCVMGWVFKYAWMSINGSMYAMQSNMEVIGSTFGQTATKWGANFWIIIALIASFAIMSMGVSGGIEKANKIMMPILFILFVLLGIYIVFQPGSSNGYKYIFTVNFEEEYRNQVFSYFLNEYKKGRTPNPDVMCNTEIKFKAFLNYALNFDCDYIAMGHYARTKNIDGKTYLCRGLDNNKDQSYFLSRVTEDALKKTLFPIGELQKDQVRKIAKDYGLSTALKKDSTGICFIGERDFNKFLDQFLFTKPGKIVDTQGNVLGEHSGLIHYTIGQRRGMGIGGKGNGEPFFVADKDLKNNLLIVAQGEKNPALYKKVFQVEDLFWISGKPHFPLKMTVKIRYRAKDEEALLEENEGKYFVKLKNPLKGVTPGQVAVFYNDEICLGSGIIK